MIFNHVGYCKVILQNLDENILLLKISCTVLISKHTVHYDFSSLTHVTKNSTAITVCVMKCVFNDTHVSHFNVELSQL